MAVGIVMGSSSDAEIMDAAVQVLREFGVEVEVRVLSAHRTPDDTLAYARGAAGNGKKVLIGFCNKNGNPDVAFPVPHDGAKRINERRNWRASFYLGRGLAIRIDIADIERVPVIGAPRCRILWCRRAKQTSAELLAIPAGCRGEKIFITAI